MESELEAERKAHEELVERSRFEAAMAAERLAKE